MRKRITRLFGRWFHAAPVAEAVVFRKKGVVKVRLRRKSYG